MSLRLFFFGFLCLLSFCVFAQRMEKVTAEYVYHAPDNISLEEAKRIALDRAKIQVIADVFGTIVSQSNFTAVTNRNGKSDVDFFSSGGSEVKGEWIESIGEPEYAISYEQGMLVIKASIVGRIREIISAGVNFKASVLCNGTDLKYERHDFRSGDDLYLYFQSPMDGYLVVYLVDDLQMVYCLLPYRNQGSGAYTVKANTSYILFSKKKSINNEVSLVDEYVMTCLREKEFNRIYVIFSPNKFSKASTRKQQSGEVSPYELTLKEFQRWLTDCRKYDKDMSLEIKDITVSR